MSISTTPKNSTTISTQTMSFDEILEHAMQEKMKTKESEIETMVKEKAKRRKTMSERLVKKLRPLCRELPDCVLDPVTYEPMKTPVSMRCSHSLSADTAAKIAAAKGLTKKDKIPCPICRTETQGYFFLYEQSFDETIQHLEKIKNLFQDSERKNDTKKVSKHSVQRKIVRKKKKHSNESLWHKKI